MTREQKLEFFHRFTYLKEAEQKVGSTIESQMRSILEKMGVSKRGADAFLGECKARGGYIDFYESLLKMTGKQKKEFFRRLEGPEGCYFRKDPKTKQATWNCAGGSNKDLSKAILEKMGVPKEEADSFLGECHGHGGHCDCEILFNAEEPIMQLEKQKAQQEKAVAYISKMVRRKRSTKT